jgi:hypothetical protein
MLIFIDTPNKIIYIMSPKCGTTTIANMLNINILHKYSKEELDNLNNPEYKKIIIIRKSIIDRFLSGFYEDLFNNNCYNNMNITFDNYLKFLHKCHNNKIPNVNNINIYNGVNIPVWFGNCNGIYSNITDKNGNFCSHIMSQKYALYNIVNNIKCKNVQIIELNDLSVLLPYMKEKNVKNKIEKISNGFNISDMTLSYIKSNKIIVSSIFLNEKQQQIILDIYKEDIVFLNELEEKLNIKL